MSVVIAREGRDPAEILVGHDGFGLVSLTVEDLASVEQVVVHDPQDDEPDHALVVGTKTQGRRREMAKASRWVIRPPEAYPPSD